jgi:hypothetical protein
VSISDTAQQVIFNAFGIVRLGVGAIIFMRCRLLQSASIRWFKQEMGWAMGDHFFVNGSLRSARQGRRLLHDPRPAAESEQIGREVWRRSRHSPLALLDLRLSRPRRRGGGTPDRDWHGTSTIAERAVCGAGGSRHGWRMREGGIPSRGRHVPRHSSCLAANSVSQPTEGAPADGDQFAQAANLEAKPIGHTVAA